MSESLQRTGERLLPSIAYGDAAGLPVETMSADEIKVRFGRIDSLLPVTINPFYKGDFDAGTWSDDTQLSIVVAESLTASDGFDLHHMAYSHIDAYEQTPQITKPNGQMITRGWGGSTTRSVQR